MTDTPQTPPASSPSTPAEAHAEIDRRIADKDFRDKLFAGDSNTTQEWNDLNALAAKGQKLQSILRGDQPSQLQSWEVISGGGLSRRDMAGAVEDLRSYSTTDVVVSNADITEISERAPVSKDAHDYAVRLKQQCMGDPEWVKRLLAGDLKAKQDALKFNAILCRPVKES